MPRLVLKSLEKPGLLRSKRQPVQRKRRRYEDLPYSHQAEEFIRMIGSGKTHVSTVASIAQAQSKDCQPVPAVAAFASLGSFGSCASNQERDLHRWLRNLHATNLETYLAPFTLDVFDHTDPQSAMVPVLLPHELLDALARAGNEQFAISMLGGRSKDALDEFWTHILQTDGWRDHAAFRDGSMPLNRTVPFTFHVDGAEVYRNTEYNIWSVGSFLAQGDVWDIKFPCCILAYASMKSHRVKRSVHRRVCQLLAWSLSCAASGKFPSHGVDGEEFDPKSYRYAMRGKPLHGGWRAAYFCARYDAKARVETNFFTRHYGCSLICEQCMASKVSQTTDPRMSYKDFREGPRHMTRITHRDYMATTPQSCLSPWSIVAGWTVESCLHDVMRVIYLGTARDLVGSLLGDFLDCGVLGPATVSVDQRLRGFSIEMNKFFKTEGISVRKLHFTASNTGLATTTEYPELGTAWKAAHVKILIGYIARKAIEFASETGEHILQGGALCAWSLAEAIRLMDSNDVIFSHDVAVEIAELLQQHLLHWQGLYQICLSSNILRWKLRPKHHSLEEISLFVRKTCVNPRFTSCFQDESYLGHIKKLGSKCHEVTMLPRVYQRLILLLSQRWKDTREHAKHANRS